MRINSQLIILANPVRNFDPTSIIKGSFHAKVLKTNRSRADFLPIIDETKLLEIIFQPISPFSICSPSYPISNLEGENYAWWSLHGGETFFFSLSLFFLSCFQLQRSFSHLSTGKIKFEERPTLRSRSVTFDWLYRKSGWNFVFSSSLNCCRVFGEAVAFSSGLSINALL